MSLTLQRTSDIEPVTFKQGNGVWLLDKKGRLYLDALNGQGANALGHSHQNIVEVITQQATKLIHTFSYRTEKQEALAEKLKELSGMEEALLVNSANDANVLALKLLSLYAEKNGIIHPRVVVIKSGLGTQTSELKILQENFNHCAVNKVELISSDMQDIENIIKASQVMAIMLNPLDVEWLTEPENGLLKLQALCNKHKLLFILDETECGLGRTGKWFTFQFENCHPDILTLSKPLAGGLPLGACLSNHKMRGLLQPQPHDYLFTASPLVCSLALTFVKTVKQYNLLANVTEQGKQLLAELQTRLSDNRQVNAIHSKGLWLEINFTKEIPGLIELGLKHGLLFDVVSERLIRLWPPYIITAEEVKELVNRLVAVIAESLL